MSKHINNELVRKNPMGPVRVTMPANVAYNIDSFHTSLKDILEELGCRTCFSGADCTFQLEREFVVNPARKFSTYSAPTNFDTFGRDVRVNVSAPERTFEINNVIEIVDQVLGELGCPQCCSGFDITFLNEFDKFVAPRVLNV